MANVSPQDLPEILEERKHLAERALADHSALRERYSEWDERVRKNDSFYANQFTTPWPDRTATTGHPRTPNLVQLASEHRARLAGSRVPTLIAPTRAGDAAKKRGEKRERIYMGWWDHNRLSYKIPYWAHDLMASGLSVCRALPDFNKPKGERFPRFERVDPRFCYPYPVFSQGPLVDSMVISYVTSAVEVEKRYGRESLNPLRAAARGQGIKEVRVIEYYDDDSALVIAELTRETMAQKKAYTVLLSERHEIGKTPITIGVRPTMDGVYRGDFDAAFALLELWNQFITLEHDAAIGRVYPVTVVDDALIDNPQDYGPDALLRKIGAGPISEAIQILSQPGEPFSNVQLQKTLAEFARAASLFPPSVSGDPNESIISAAGISATQSGPNAHVASLQKDSIAPMLEAAYIVGAKGDERWADVEKEVRGSIRGAEFTEKYKPSRDLAGEHRVQVVYGFGAGLDEINSSVMMLQQWNGGQGVISKRTAAENSIFVKDPIAEEKRQMAEGLQTATMAGLQAKALQGEITPRQLAAVEKAVSDEDMTLRDAIAKFLPEAPMMPAPQPGGGGPPGAPGVPGAERGPQPITPLSEVRLGG